MQKASATGDGFAQTSISKQTTRSLLGGGVDRVKESHPGIGRAALTSAWSERVQAPSAALRSSVATLKVPIRRLHGTRPTRSNEWLITSHHSRPLTPW